MLSNDGAGKEHVPKMKKVREKSLYSNREY